MVRIGAVHITVTSLEQSLAFYRDVLGLAARVENHEAVLSAGGGGLLRLTERRDLRAPSQGPGLFHFALLVPSRRELARALDGLRQRGWPVQGASDHGVSEALYLADPDGHGIEIYADRPRDSWRRSGDEIVMVTRPLDLAGLMAETAGKGGSDGKDDEWGGLPAGTVMGHIHLRVRDLDQAELFFSGRLGLGVTVRSYPGARFFAAGGYHHHVGVNTWWRAREGDGAGRVGLVAFELLKPGAPESRFDAPDAAYSVVVRPGASG